MNHNLHAINIDFNPFMETVNCTGFWDHMIPIILAFKPVL